MAIKEFVPPRIQNDRASIEWFGNLCRVVGNEVFERIEIDFSNCTWFDAQFSACLGAILSKASELNEIVIQNVSIPVASILRKNGFLTNYGFPPLRDSYETTIPFKKFASGEEKVCRAYIDAELLSKPELPKLSNELKKAISKSIIEIFINAYTHSGSESVFCCGQFYPAKGKLEFSMVNLGNTFRKNVSTFLGTKKTSVEALLWAVQEGNTTRTGSVPGGLGLSLIRKFIKLNDGKIEIVSAQGMWQQAGEAVHTMRFENTFPGTIVTFEINVGDENSYVLSSESQSI